MTKLVDQRDCSLSDDYCFAVQWLFSSLARCTCEGLVYDLELLFGALRDRAPLSVITVDQRDGLSPALLEASYLAMDLMPESYGRDQIETAFDAAQSILHMWSTPLEERGNRASSPAWEWFCIAGMFQADLKNLRLAAEITQRRQRSADTKPFHFHSHGVIPTGGAKIVSFPQRSKGVRHDR